MKTERNEMGITEDLWEMLFHSVKLANADIKMINDETVIFRTDKSKAVAHRLIEEVLTIVRERDTAERELEFQKQNVEYYKADSDKWFQKYLKR